MLRFPASLCLLISLARTLSATVSPPDTHKGIFWNACHYPHFTNPFETNATFSAENYTPGLCSHLIFSFGKRCTSQFCPIKDKKEALTPDNANSSELHRHISEIRRKDATVRTILTITPSSDGALECTTCDVVVQEFVHSKILQLCRKMNVDGIMLSWGSRLSADAFTALVKSLRDAIDKESTNAATKNRLLLGVQLYPGRDNYYDYHRMERNIDFAMARARRNTDSTAEDKKQIGVFEKASPEKWKVETTVKKLLELGMPARKIVLTIPLVAIKWIPKTYPYAAYTPNKKCPDFSTHVPDHVIREEKVYHKVWDEAKRGVASIHWSEEHGVLFANETLAIQCERSLLKAIRFIREEGLAGAYVVSLNDDDYTARQPFPLVRIVADALRNPLRTA